MSIDVSFTSAVVVVWSARWRLQREQRELKTPQERAFRDEEAEAVPEEANRMLVTKALPHDVALLAFVLQLERKTTE